MKRSAPSRTRLLRDFLPSLLKLLATVWVGLSGATSSAQTVLVPTGSVWNYLDNGSNQGTAWQASGFNDNTWKSGPAQLGYGDGDEVTRVEDNATAGYVSTDTDRYITTYFRKAFEVVNPAAFQNLALRLLRDDGAIVYLNGVEVFRSNMPAGTVTSSTLASTAVGGTDESAYFQTNVSPSQLVAGTNVLAVELHQIAANSSDISFDLELASASIVTRAPYLQIGTPPNAQTGTCSMSVRWRTSIATDSVVRYGLSPTDLTLQASNATSTTEHEVTLSGLAADTRYYYSVGSSTATHAGSSGHVFFTAPPTGAGNPTRIWVLGDAGTGTANQAAVRDAYYNFANGSYTDVLLMLGDNVYETGTDVEYTTRHFDVYRDILRQTVSWPAIGNHDTAGSATPSSTIPYYQSFSLPMSGEAGGVASGTEDYYSFDYGDIHFICLDSMTSTRTATSPMVTWLRQDLAATLQKWVIAYWHHPPYSFGTNSDTDTIATEMRTNVVSVLEEYGVDLVLLGHSHTYERTYLMDGHYGTSSTFNKTTMVKDGSDGRSVGGYNKPTLGGAGHEGAVYTVAGSSGKTQDYAKIVDNGTGNGTGHPAMFISWERLGSVVVDVDGHQMDVKFLRENGTIGDTFSITRGPRTNVPPGVTITAPVTGEQFSENSPITISATATDSDQGIQEVVFYANSSRIGVVSNTSTPDRYQVNYLPPKVGSYTFEARAVDQLGNSTVSAPVNVTVAVGPPTPDTTAPDAVANLATSTITTTSVTLNWTAPGDDLSVGTATAYDVRYSTAPVDETNWATALQAAAEPTPDPVGTSQSMTVSGLITETQYYLALKTADEAGNVSSLSNVVSAITSVVPPNAPSELTGAPDPAEPSAKVNLAWTDNSFTEEGFQIERSTDGGGSYFPLADTPTDTTTYVDGYVSPPGRTYVYRVSAYRGGAYSPPSNVVSVTTAPAPPTSLTAKPSATQVNLQWAASLGAETYTVRREIFADGTVTYAIVRTGIVGTAFTDSDLTPQTSYFYRVTAVNTGGESTPAEIGTATTAPPPIPAAPTNLAAAGGDAQVALNWSASDGAATYNVKRSTTAGGGYVGIASGITATDYTDAPTANGTTYYYVVSASNSSGESVDSNEASAIPQIPPPPAPAGLTATGGNAKVSLVWGASSTAVSYRVKRASSGGPYVEIASELTATSYVDGAVTNGVAYSYVVTAVNAAGESAPSNTATATPIEPIPAAPSNLVATAVSRTQINLSWADNSSNETGFRVERSTDGVNYTPLEPASGANVKSYASTGLTRNKVYYHRVRSFNTSGSSNPSNTTKTRTLK